jgi:hypothetical protein
MTQEGIWDEGGSCIISIIDISLSHINIVARKKYPFKTFKTVFQMFVSVFIYFTRWCKRKRQGWSLNLNTTQRATGLSKVSGVGRVADGPSMDVADLD